MAKPRRNVKGQDLETAIIQAAYRQIAEEGATTLSLRSIARELGITAPAIYNYYTRRDDLVTALIVDAYRSLGDSQRSVLTSLESANLGDHLSALGLSYRQWAITYPQRYQLIFGTPLPHYTAPEDKTVPAAAWSLEPLIGVLTALWQSGRLRTQKLPPRSSKLDQMLANWQQFIVAMGAMNAPDKEVLYFALVIWSRVHGLVMLEIGGQLPSFISDAGEIFRREIRALVSELISDGNL